MRAIYFLIGCLLVIGSAVAQAEIYQYRDANGVLRYTDNYLEVPPEQRPDFEPSEPSAQESAVTPPKEGQPAAAADDQANAGAQTDSGSAPPSDPAVEVLKQEQADLLAEYQILSSERDRLEALRESRKSVEEVEQFNADAAALSQRIESFNQRKEKLDGQLRSYVELIEGYNESVEAMAQPEAEAPESSPSP